MEDDLTTQSREAHGLVPPRSELEVQLCGIWSDVLRRPVGDVSVSFADLGGSSILAAMVAAKIQLSLGVRVDLTTIFRCRTVQALAASVENAGTRPAGPAGLVTTTAEDIPLVPVPDRDGLPMSFFQDWRFHADQDRSTPLYTIALGYELHGRLRLEALRDAISELAGRHEPLRTNYDIVDGRAVQVIHPARAVELPVLDVRGSSGNGSKAEALRLLNETAAQSLDRRSDAMFQPLLARFADEGHILLLRLDRIAVDGASCQILEDELSTLYSCFLAGSEPAERPALQQADWASWQRQLLRPPRLGPLVDYWRHTLDGTRPLLELRLPGRLGSPGPSSFRGRLARGQLGADVSGDVRRRAREADVTLFMYALAALGTFIARLSGQDTATILCPFANRTRPELERLVGCFAHGVIHRIDLSGDPGFSEVVTRVRDVCLEAWEHQDLPVSEVARHVRPASYLTLYDEFHVFCDLVRDQPPFRLDGLDVAPAEVATGAAHPSLAVFIDDTARDLGLIMRADAGRFDDAALAWCIAEFSGLLAEAAREPEQRISALPPSPEAVRRRFGDR